MHWLLAFQNTGNWKILFGVNLDENGLFQTKVGDFQTSTWGKVRQCYYIQILYNPSAYL